MLRLTQATPCPSHGEISRFDSLDKPNTSWNGDDTSKIDFTLDLGTSLLLHGPRRRQTAVKPRRQRAIVNFSVHEDGDAQREIERKEITSLEAPNVKPKKSMLAQPAQRFRPRVSFVAEAVQSENGQALEQPYNGPEDLDVRPQPSLYADRPLWDQSPNMLEKKVQRPSRRKTVYIPTEDTTMPSIHMGVFSPIKSLEGEYTGADQQHAIELTGIAAQMGQKRRPRKSLGVALAKRLPLRRSMRDIQETRVGVDIPGEKTGKENIPPGVFDHSSTPESNKIELFGSRELQPKASKASSPICLERPRQSQKARPDQDIERSKPPAVSRSKYLACRPSVTPETDSRGCAPTIRHREPQPAYTLHSLAKPASESPILPLKATTANQMGRAGVHLITPAVDHVQIGKQYPLISENISDPSLYEDNWLAHQEIAITQLVNHLFACSKGSDGVDDSSALRYKLLEMYQEPSISLLHKRVQASVMYGALSVPKDVLARALRLRNDLGVRQAFVDLWLKTYNLIYLKGALEVVVARRCSVGLRSLPHGQDEYHLSDKTSRQAVQKYIETFLIRNEDSIQGDGNIDNAASCYQRTLTRSLLLIKLLDKAKMAPNRPMPGCLFLTSSPHKSSIAVAQALARLLGSAAGDVPRVLAHLDYTLSQVQHPLEEFNYQIDNLAVDLRDGVRLTRLVELLLYPSTSQLLCKSDDETNTGSITMPGGEVLSLGQGKHTWPLSQHLKFPCLGRAPRLFNVQIALSALSGVKGLTKILEDVQAEDIVDGYREKSVALLWGLTGRWGLAGLIDWADIRHEIRRLGRRQDVPMSHHGEDELDDRFVSSEDVLKKWASTIASGRGLQIDNLSTALSSGDLFDTILDEYEPYLQCDQSAGSKPQLLHQRLAALGCSGPFCR